jgi:hypothetical protein
MFESCQKNRFISSVKCPDGLWVPPRLLLNWNWWLLPQAVKWAGHKAGHSSSFSASIKNEWMCSITILSCLYSMCEDNSTLLCLRNCWHFWYGMVLWEFTGNVIYANAVMVREIRLIIKSLSNRVPISLCCHKVYMFYIFKLMVAAFGWLIMVCSKCCLNMNVWVPFQHANFLTLWSLVFLFCSN